MTTYSADIIALSPVSYWRLGETSGTTADDVQNAHDGTYVQPGLTMGETGGTTGDSNTCFLFNGTAAQLVETSGWSLSSAAYTMVALVKVHSTPPTTFHATIMGLQVDGTQRARIYARRNDANDRLAYWDNTNLWQESTAATLTPGTWYHVAVVVNNTNVSFRVNGAAAGSLTITAPADTYGVVNIGGASTAGDPMKGHLDEVALFSSALTSTQIDALYASWLNNGTRTGAATGAISWAGSATGKRVAAGLATGALLFAGSATGAVAHRGAATGSVAYAGSATGQSVHSGSASGAVSWSGSATGARTSSGAVTGALSWVGAVTGTSVHSGAATGSVTWAGSATGEAPASGVSEGSATGGVTWAGTATGARPSAGAATGAISWAGSATGKRVAAGLATGSITWTGAATGVRASSGASAGAATWVGSATGTTARGGTVSGAVLWTGSATGSAGVVVNGVPVANPVLTITTVSELALTTTTGVLGVDTPQPTLELTGSP